MIEKILGIDLGTNSIGMALRDLSKGDSLQKQLVYYSSDIFKAGIGNSKSGEYSYAAERRRHRLSRRLYATRRRRLWATLQLLLDYELCPISQFSLDSWRIYGRMVKSLCLGVDLAESEDEESCVVYAV